MIDVVRLTRRMAQVLAACLAGVGVAVTPAAAGVVPEDGVIAFDVLRNGSTFGSHMLTFQDTDGGMTVSVDIDLKVKIGPFTAFRYRHDIQEVWSGGALQSVTSQTLKDGEEFSLNVARVGDGFSVAGRDYAGPADGGLLPTSWWNRDILSATSAINSETGAVIPVTVEPLGRESIVAGGQTIEAERYRITSTLVVDVWYDDAGRWVKCAFEARGTDVEYVLRGPEEGGA